MKDERGDMKINYVIPPSLIRRGMESLTAYSECRDAIHRMINHPLWHDVLMMGDKKKDHHASAPFSAEALAEKS